MQHQRCRRQPSVFRRLQRCCEWCRERRGMCLSVRGTFLSIYTAVPVRLAALPDTLLSTYETNPGDLSPHPCIPLRNTLDYHRFSRQSIFGHRHSEEKTARRRQLGRHSDRHAARHTRSWRRLQSGSTLDGTPT